ncbi:hypothetical protein [Streptacidiphilus rugosus]|uniref:hypothetical protein n=1 Tax=Streptacidiphilus rugosus TaxID=405783 RepID=UPI0007C7F249|nr:hypothetical protein [Streptacidiphilus rugosus]
MSTVVITVTTAAATKTSTAQATPTAQDAPAVPSVHRRALITWLAVYPTITTAFFVLGPHTAHLPIPLRTLILTAVVVPVVVYLLVPLLLKGNARLDARFGAALSARRARRSGGA